MIPWSTYLVVLRRRWWVVLLVLLGAVGAAAVLTWRQEPIYRASTKLVVIPNEQIREEGDFIRSLDTLDRRSVIATLADLPETNAIRAEAQEALGFSPEQRRDLRVRTAVLPNTNIVRIDVEGPDAERASVYANGMARVTRERAAELYRIYEMRIIEQATPRRTPVHPNPRRNYTVAVILGLLGGLAAAYGLDALLGRA